MSDKGFCNRQTRCKQAKENRSKSSHPVDDTPFVQKLWDCHMLLRSICFSTGQPLISPWRNTGKNEIVPGQTELRPDVDGLTIAIACTADEAQEIIDFMIEFETRRQTKKERSCDAN